MNRYRLTASVGLILATMAVTSFGQLHITYFDNYNYETGEWDDWSTWPSGGFWDNEYLVDFTSGKTEPTEHYRSSVEVLDLRNGFASLDDPPHDVDWDWNPLKSMGDTTLDQSPHHLFGAIFAGVVYLEAGQVLLVESDDDVYVFLDDTEVLAIPYISFFEEDSMVVPPDLAGYQWMTVLFVERQVIHSGIEMRLDGEPLQAVLIATVEIKPETLNLKSKGVFTAFVGLPNGLDVADILVETVECEGTPAVKGMLASDKLIVQFNTQDLAGVAPGKEVEFAVTGELADGRRFIGYDTIRVID